ncbi:MAG: Bor family protein [Oligoflexales bacterium]|nr:Bor family protein [Oligoflexales bacterium]
MLKKLCIIALIAASCKTVTIKPGGGSHATREPDFSETQHFFFWGLMPDAKFVNVNDVCKGRQVEQMRAKDTGMDGFYTIITLGIYNPRTAQVWCKEENKKVADIDDEVLL